MGNSTQVGVTAVGGPLTGECDCGSARDEQDTSLDGFQVTESRHICTCDIAIRTVKCSSTVVRQMAHANCVRLLCQMLSVHVNNQKMNPSFVTDR